MAYLRATYNGKVRRLANSRVKRSARRDLLRAAGRTDANVMVEARSQEARATRLTTGGTQVTF